MPISGLDRSIPFRSCQACPASQPRAGATGAPEFDSVNEWGPYLPASQLLPSRPWSSGLLTVCMFMVKVVSQSLLLISIASSLTVSAI